VISSLSFFGGCSCSDKEDTNSIETSIKESIETFKQSKIEMKLTNGETILYHKVIDLIRTETGASHTTKIKELSPSLYEESMYQESENNGTLTNEELKEIFPSSEQFKGDKISVILDNENEKHYVISKDNLMSVFDLKIQEMNKISNEGIKVIFIYESNKINEYSYVYKTTDNIDVVIKGTFTYN